MTITSPLPGNTTGWTPIPNEHDRKNISKVKGLFNSGVPVRIKFNSFKGYEHYGLVYCTYIYNAGFVCLVSYGSFPHETFVVGFMYSNSVWQYEIQKL